MSEFDDAVLRIKAWWKSATIWLAGLVVAVSQVPADVIAMLHPDLRDWAYTALGLAILWDRLFNTNQAVTVRAAEKPVTSDKTVPK